MATKPKDQLASALGMIETTRASQVGGIQALGTAQDSNISSIYNTLQGGLQQGARNTQAIYDRGGQNVRNAYGLGGQQAGAANAGAMSQISDNSSRLGMDPRALAEVQGKLSMQAGLFANRNAQSSRETSATMAQQGAGMTAISQMAVQAAQHAAAQGKMDLSRRILQEVSKANSAAGVQKAGATMEAANRTAKEAASARAEAAAAMRAVASEQRAAAREARAAERSSRGREKDPLDQMIKALRIKQMESGMDPESAKNQIQGFALQKLLDAEEERNGETADDVWADIRGRFPNKGVKTIDLLERAMSEGAKEKDESGITSRNYIKKHKGGLDLQVELEQLQRLMTANSRRR